MLLSMYAKYASGSSQPSWRLRLKIVAEGAGDELSVVLVAALEEPEVRGERVVLVGLQREVYSDARGVHAALLGEVAPYQDRRRPSLEERLLRVVHLEAVALDDSMYHVEGSRPHTTYECGTTAPADIRARR
jgi:hypothetical protein